MSLAVVAMMVESVVMTEQMMLTVLLVMLTSERPRVDAVWRDVGVAKGEIFDRPRSAAISMANFGSDPADHRTVTEIDMGKGSADAVRVADAGHKECSRLSSNRNCAPL